MGVSCSLETLQVFMVRLGTLQMYCRPLGTFVGSFVWVDGGCLPSVEDMLVFVVSWGHAGFL